MSEVEPAIQHFKGTCARNLRRTLNSQTLRELYWLISCCAASLSISTLSILSFKQMLIPRLCGAWEALSKQQNTSKLSFEPGRSPTCVYYMQASPLSNMYVACYVHARFFTMYITHTRTSARLVLAHASRPPCLPGSSLV